MRVVVTGAAGFIGSNLVLGLNRMGVREVIAVDDLTDGPKFLNLVKAQISDYFDKSDFYSRFARGEFGKIDAILHQGACSDTMEHNGRFMMDNNYRNSKDLLDACMRQGTRLLYASSAATYGASQTFREEPAFERPLNVYGYSKLLFDQVVRQHLPHSPVQIAGFRYFNVYGPHEQHKGRMASVAFHHFHQAKSKGHVELFGPYGGYDAGQQERDFVFIDDVVKVNLWFLEHPQPSGIFNLGSGRAQPFNDVAVATMNAHLQQHAAQHGQSVQALTLQELVNKGLIRYIPFPESLVGKYQCHTQADLSALRRAGYTDSFTDVQTGVGAYMAFLATADQS
jgi:ADP-L-glycero-D-manno-heptose 6-epimerase